MWDIVLRGPRAGVCYKRERITNGRQVLVTREHKTTTTFFMKRARIRHQTSPYKPTDLELDAKSPIE